MIGETDKLGAEVLGVEVDDGVLESSSATCASEHPTLHKQHIGIRGVGCGVEHGIIHGNSTSILKEVVEDFEDLFVYLGQVDRHRRWIAIYIRPSLQEVVGDLGDEAVFDGEYSPRWTDCDVEGVVPSGITVKCVSKFCSWYVP